MSNMERDNNQDIKITVLETNYKSMSGKIDDLKKSVDTGFAEMKEELKCMRQENDKRYASKLTELIVYGLVGLILVYWWFDKLNG
jgi:hypothetical protein